MKLSTFGIHFMLAIISSGVSVWSWLKADDYHAINDYWNANKLYAFGALTFLLGLANLKKICPSDDDFEEWVDYERQK